MTVPEEVAKLSTLLFESITDCALKSVRLEAVRSDRTAPSDSIMDAAQAFRRAEGKVNENVQGLIAAQVKALKAVGT